MSSSNTVACASCKYQRRRCTIDCPLAPYFPPERQTQFTNARKLFGVSYMTKMINGIHETERETAMKNLIFHADVRARYPVGGLCSFIWDLKCKIVYYQAELNLVQQQLLLHRPLAQQQQQTQRQYLSYEDLLGQEEEYIYVNDNDLQNLQEHQETQQQQQH